MTSPFQDYFILNSPHETSGIYKCHQFIPKTDLMTRLKVQTFRIHNFFPVNNEFIIDLPYVGQLFFVCAYKEKKSLALCSGMKDIYTSIYRTISRGDIEGYCIVLSIMRRHRHYFLSPTKKTLKIRAVRVYNKYSEFKKTVYLLIL